MPINMQKINIDKELCTGCRRCAEVCPVDAIEGEQDKPQKINSTKCIMCGQCVQICNGYAPLYEPTKVPISKKSFDRGVLESVKEPIFAAYNLGQTKDVKEMLRNNDMLKVVQCAPAVRVAIGEDFGLPYGSLTPGKMAAALRKLGFDKVYDTNFGADLTIMEEGSELIKRLKEGGVFPMFTSCCPAWVKYMEQTYPELLEHLSSCKSPMSMTSAIIKSYGSKLNNIDSGKIYSVAVMPCTCKGFESERQEINSSEYKDTDAVITTRELAHLIKDAGINFDELDEEEMDNPLGKYTGSGAIFGATGGVMEAALRTGYELWTKETIPDVNLSMIRGKEGFRTAEVQLGNLTLKVGMISGLKYAKQVLESIKNGECDLHFIEVMTCPEGCISGGGQPKLLLNEQRENAYISRKKAIYVHDENLTIRKSHENPGITKLYKEFLGEPLGHNSHKFLHTKYSSRK